MADGIRGLLDELQKQRKDLKLPSLLKRDFQTACVLTKDELPSSTANPSGIRIMQWNLLAQALSQGSDSFVLCPQDALEWEHRKLHVMEEILTYNATVVCLEEVDHFEFVKDLLEKVGYSGCFFPKPDSPCLYSHINYGPDGCAMFWKVDQVEMVQRKDIVLRDKKGMETNQVAIICKFKHMGLGREFCVAVTHLKSKPPYWQMRYEQGSYLERVLCETVTPSAPLVLCGDFNAEPTEQVYATFKSSQLKLSSAYCYLSDELEEPEYTTWKVRGGPLQNQKEVAHCIDYVWFSVDHLQPTSLLKLPTGEEVGKERLPSLTYPSDHLSLVVDFVFCG